MVKSMGKGSPDFGNVLPEILQLVPTELSGFFCLRHSNFKVFGN